MIMRNILLFVLGILIYTTSVNASHLEGGEITWECLSTGPTQGMYVFTMKVYRDCNGVNLTNTPQTITVHDHPFINSIQVDYLSNADISPPCDPVNSGNLAYDCTSNIQVGSVEEWVYQSMPINLPGLPPNTGWHFTWSSCCRNASITNLPNPSSLGFTLRAVMYPYTPASTGVQQNTSPCFDSSPVFNEQPKTIICNGYPFSYSHNASDAELDSLVYEWGEPLDQGYTLPAGGTPIAFQAPYTLNSQIPGAPTLNPNTGEISYNSMTSGNFVTCIKVSSYKCGQLVAEIYREIQVILISCPNIGGAGPNNKPIVNPPFNGGTSYSTSVYAGDLVSFNISGTDADLYPGGTSQDLTLEVSGGQFSANYIDTSLCLNPPCATFNNGAGLVPPFSAPTTVNGVFEWQTDCGHIAANVGCNATSNLYTFLIKVFDDFCPAPAITIATISVEVLAAPTDNPPDIRCVSVDNNGGVIVSWEHLPTAQSSTFYNVYSSANPAGPFTFLDTVGYPSSSYYHSSAGANNSSIYYYLTSESDCAGTSDPSDTLQTIELSVTPINNGTIGDLQWNNIHNPSLTTSSANFDVFALDGSGSWVNVGNTLNTNFQFPAQTCGSSQRFFVSLEDASGCVSRSSIDEAILRDTISPNNPIIEVVTVSGGKSVISWSNSSPDVHVYAIYILNESGTWITIDSVFGAANTTYTYNGSAADNNYETFRIRSLDSCYNSSGTSLNHNTIYLNSSLDVCDYSIYFNWNDYNNMIDGLSHYKVLITEITSTGNINSEFRLNTGDNNFTLPNISSGSVYDVVVVGYNIDSTIASYSNVVNIDADLFPKPQFNYITKASVNHQSGSIELNCHVDDGAVIDYYRILRSKKDENIFSDIANIPFNGQTNITYLDDAVNSNSNYYNYQIYPVDTCGVTLTVGSTQFANDTSFAQTILLETFNNNDITNDLTFNNYDGWLGGVIEYNIYRSVNRGDFSALPVTSFIGGDDVYNYKDDVIAFINGNGRFCYYVEALEGSSNPYGFVERSLSNISCVSQVPVLIIPSSFTPNDDEHNEIFYPVTSFVSEVGYQFSIYDKWGHLIFQTNDPKKGWDGNYLGSPAQNGNYVYHVQYVNGVGLLTEKTDIVNVIR